MLVVGLTGSFGTGKSLVAGMFARLGAKVVDADRIVHQLLNSNGPCHKAIIGQFGTMVVTQRKLDKKKMAQLIFSDKGVRRNIEGIIHPFVRKEIRKQLAALNKSGKRNIVVLDVPLLFESGIDRLADATIVVKTSRAVQFFRLIKKYNFTQAQARARIKAQLPLTRKIRRADYIIDNNGSINDTRKQVKRLWQILKIKNR